MLEAGHPPEGVAVDLGPLVVTLLVATLVVLLIGVALLAVVVGLVWRNRVPLRGVLALLGGLAYLVVPVDAVPEFPLGPIGWIDDLAVLAAAGSFAYRQVQARRAAELSGSAYEPTPPPGPRGPGEARGR